MDGMPKLSTRSDGISETESGLFAIVPKHVTGSRDGKSWFFFKTTHYGAPTRLEWATESALILVDQDTANFLLLRGHATSPAKDLVKAYNEAATKYNKELAEQAEVKAAADKKAAEEKAAADAAAQKAKEVPAPPAQTPAATAPTPPATAPAPVATPPAPPVAPPAAPKAK